MKKLATIVGLAISVVAALAAVWLLGMRNKQSIVVTTQRRINRDVFNPRQMRSAGRPGAYAAIMRHTGRSSGRVYETPVGVEETDVGFVIALVYGSDTDWLRNVLASGGATIVHDGAEHDVVDPRVVPFASVAHHFDDAQMIRLFGVTDALALTTKA